MGRLSTTECTYLPTYLPAVRMDKSSSTSIRWKASLASASELSPISALKLLRDI